MKTWFDSDLQLRWQMMANIAQEELEDLLHSFGIADAKVVPVTMTEGNNPEIPTQQDVQTKIIGKWKKTVTDGVEVLTYQRAIRRRFPFQHHLHVEED